MDLLLLAPNMALHETHAGCRFICFTGTLTQWKVTFTVVATCSEI